MLMKKLFGVTAAIALATVLGSPSVVLAQNFNEIYVFGDSLSDVGNAFETTKGDSPPSPPYFRGRYSNGPVWVEYLASKLNLTFNPDTNFAFGGATTGNSRETPPGLLAQIENFTATHSSANPKAVYIVWAGANDYLGGDTDSTTPINNLSKAVRSLLAVGAKNIVVVNLPDLGKLPGMRITQRSNSLNQLTKEHNSRLATSLNALRPTLSSDVNVSYLDVNTLFNRAIASPEKYGFKNVTKACFTQGIKCQNPNEYLFWDDIHPTTAAHKLLVELSLPTLKLVSENSLSPVSNFTVPLGILVLGGLGAGLILKRKKAIKGKV